MSEQRRFRKTKRPVSRNVYWANKTKRNFYSKDEQEKEQNDDIKDLLDDV